jgi:hypothetical protein
LLAPTLVGNLTSISSFFSFQLSTMSHYACTICITIPTDHSLPGIEQFTSPPASQLFRHPSSQHSGNYIRHRSCRSSRQTYTENFNNFKIRQSYS